MPNCIFLIYLIITNTPEKGQKDSEEAGKEGQKEKESDCLTQTHF